MEVGGPPVRGRKGLGGDRDRGDRLPVNSAPGSLGLEAIANVDLRRLAPVLSGSGSVMVLQNWATKNPQILKI